MSWSHKPYRPTSTSGSWEQDPRARREMERGRGKAGEDISLLDWELPAMWRGGSGSLGLNLRHPLEDAGMTESQGGTMHGREYKQHTRSTLLHVHCQQSSRGYS